MTDWEWKTTFIQIRLLKAEAEKLADKLADQADITTSLGGSGRLRRSARGLRSVTSTLERIHEAFKAEIVARDAIQQRRATGSGTSNRRRRIRDSIF